jgi:hypothetical protein
MCRTFDATDAANLALEVESAARAGHLCEGEQVQALKAEMRRAIAAVRDLALGPNP